MGKLVRDNLEELIKGTHEQASFKYVEGLELEAELKVKLKEELVEYLKATTLQNKTEEAADILEVLECLLNLNGVSMKEVMLEKNEKVKMNGSFKSGLYWLDQ